MAFLAMIGQMAQATKAAQLAQDYPFSYHDQMEALHALRQIYLKERSNAKSTPKTLEPPLLKVHEVWNRLRSHFPMSEELYELFIDDFLGKHSTSKGKSGEIQCTTPEAVPQLLEEAREVLRELRGYPSVQVISSFVQKVAEAIPIADRDSKRNWLHFAWEINRFHYQLEPILFQLYIEFLEDEFLNGTDSTEPTDEELALQDKRVVTAHYDRLAHPALPQWENRRSELQNWLEETRNESLLAEEGETLKPPPKSIQQNIEKFEAGRPGTWPQYISWAFDNAQALVGNEKAKKDPSTTTVFFRFGFDLCRRCIWESYFGLPVTDAGKEEDQTPEVADGGHSQERNAKAKVLAEPNLKFALMRLTHRGMDALRQGGTQSKPSSKGPSPSAVKNDLKETFSFLLRFFPVDRHFGSKWLSAVKEVAQEAEDNFRGRGKAMDTPFLQHLLLAGATVAVGLCVAPTPPLESKHQLPQVPLLSFTDFYREIVDALLSTSMTLTLPETHKLLMSFLKGIREEGHVMHASEAWKSYLTSLFLFQATLHGQEEAGSGEAENGEGAGAKEAQGFERQQASSSTRRKVVVEALQEALKQYATVEVGSLMAASVTRTELESVRVDANSVRTALRLGTLPTNPLRQLLGESVVTQSYDQQRKVLKNEGRWIEQQHHSVQLTTHAVSAPNSAVPNARPTEGTAATVSAKSEGTPSLRDGEEPPRPIARPVFDPERSAFVPEIPPPLMVYQSATDNSTIDIEKTKEKLLNWFCTQKGVKREGIAKVDVGGPSKATGSFSATIEATSADVLASVLALDRCELSLANATGNRSEGMNRIRVKTYHRKRGREEAEGELDAEAGNRALGVPNSTSSFQGARSTFLPARRRLPPTLSKEVHTSDEFFGSALSPTPQANGSSTVVGTETKPSTNLQPKSKSFFDSLLA